ncbi:MAG TPA: hypothetical protein VGL77_11545 [Armatimonadota bacterium]|jgi:hypothetical protein
MKQFTILAMLATVTIFGLARPASAQAVPSVIGISAYSAEAQYMSLVGYLRWQMFEENNVWISQAEAVRLVRGQVSGAK